MNENIKGIMKIVVLQENLIKGINAVSRVTTTSGKLPVLSHIVLLAQKQGLFLQGTDLELSLKLRVGAKIEKKGEFGVPAKLFSEFIASLNPGRVELEVKSGQMEVRSSGNKANFQGMVSEFPEIPTTIKTELFEYEGGSVEKDVSQVVFAAASDETRPVLTGVQWKREGKYLRMVATDGYRLSIKKVKVSFPKLKQSQNKDWIKIVPAKALTELTNLAKQFEKDEKITVGLTEDGNQVVFKFKEGVLVSRLLEGEFPPFEKILPEEGETKIKFKHDKLLAAVRMAAIFARESANLVKWGVGKNKVTLKANSPQIGENESEIEAEVSGKGGNIAFNSRYLLDFLSAVEVDGKKAAEINFEMSGSLAPGLFTVSGDDSYQHVVMPVRVQEKERSG